MALYKEELVPAVVQFDAPRNERPARWFVHDPCNKTAMME